MWDILLSGRLCMGLSTGCSMCCLIVVMLATLARSATVIMESFEVIPGKAQSTTDADVGSVRATSEFHCGGICTKTPACQLATFFSTSTSERNCFMGSCTFGQLYTNNDASTMRRKVHGARVDCKEWLNDGFACDGVYPVTLGGAIEVDVVCDMTLEDGGWTVMQQRRDFAVDFNREWNAFVSVFGDVGLWGNYWLGLENIYQLTNLGAGELYVNMRKLDGSYVYARYTSFNIGDATGDYILNVGGYSGNAGDSMAHSNGWPFSTLDNDNKSPSCDRQCVSVCKSAWWYNCCTNSALNGLYTNATQFSGGTGLLWWVNMGHTGFMQVTMLVRRL